MPETASDYDPETTAVSLSVLMEVFACLGEYRKNAVLVGGWVPYLTCPQEPILHCGSRDIDIVLDSRKISQARYEDLSAILKKRGFVSKGKNDFRFEREVVNEGRTIKIQLDLLAQERGGRGKNHRTQMIQDLRGRKARGGDLALEEPHEFVREGILPSGAKDRVKIRIARPMPFLVMKATALADRLKEKDAYDIYWICKYHPDGREAIARAFAARAKEPLVAEAVDTLKEKFGAVDRRGPIFVSDFLMLDVTNRDISARDAYETVQDLLRRL